jgi:uncharacterized protein
MEQLNNAFTLFLSLLVEAIPFLLLGVLLSSVLLIFIDERWLIAHLPKHPVLGAFAGSCIGGKTIDYAGCTNACGDRIFTRSTDS